MQKKWQVKPAAGKDFFGRFPDYERLLLQLLYNRGLTEGQVIENFLNTDLSSIQHDPYLFRDMSRALDLIVGHIKQGDKIVIYGDYDADGVTSSAVLSEIFRIMRAEVDVYIPNRVTEGYGMNISAVEEIAKTGAKLIITVDNGIRNKAEVARAKELGMDVIVTDHHPAPQDKDDFPDCPIINPTITDDTYPFAMLAGVGVAFKLASALVDRSKLEPLLKEKLKEQVLDLVAIGTVADCSSLVGENRALVRKGLEILQGLKRIGLKELCTVAALNPARPLDTWNIGFQIAPRLNAAGRMDHANTAYELLITRSQELANSLARSLNERNYDRQLETERITDEIRKQIEPQLSDKILVGKSPKLSAEDESWSEGVVGLVAGRICEEYYLPTLVLTGHTGELKGSGRSIAEFNITKALEECKEYLEKFGGHPAACGLGLKEESFEAFQKKIKEVAARELGKMDLSPKLSIDMELDLAEVNEEAFDSISKLSPFGMGNEQPKFLSKDVLIADISNMGASGQHIKFKVKGKNNGLKTALAFGQSERWQDIKLGDRVDMVYYIDMNEFNGRREVQMKVVDIKKLKCKN